jgi:hypothetical protein
MYQFRMTIERLVSLIDSGYSLGEIEAIDRAA